MNKQEIEERIEEIEGDIFMINMADHLSGSDYQQIRKLNEEKRELKIQLASIK